MIITSGSTAYKTKKSQQEIRDYQQVMVTNVFGEATEPICNYRTCSSRLFIAWPRYSYMSMSTPTESSRRSNKETLIGKIHSSH